MRVHPSLVRRDASLTTSPADLKPELAFSKAEYQERLARARAAMNAQGLDALVVMNPASVFYLSGYQTFRRGWRRLPGRTPRGRAGAGHGSAGVWRRDAGRVVRGLARVSAGDRAARLRGADC